MFDFIPLSDYTMYFNYTILVMVLVAFWQCNTGISLQKNTATLNAMWGILFTILLILYMGRYPVCSVIRLITQKDFMRYNIL